MSGTVKLIGSADQRWDDTLENADHSVDTRLIGKEDIYWDSEGKDEQGSFVDRLGTDRPITLLNASHIPLPIAAREACDGAENIAAGMIKLSQMAGSGGGSSGMTEDKSVTIAASLTHAQKQTLINSQTRNLGGHTLTFEFPEAIDLVFNDSLTFSGFYNGFLVIDLNGITISDNINLTKLFSIYDCHSKVEVKDGTMKHTFSLYAIYAIRCPHVYLTNMIFIGSGGTTNYAFCGIDSDGYSTECTYSNDNTVQLAGFGATDARSRAESVVGTHNMSDSAHAALFAGKANASHTHTPAQVHADLAGTADIVVSHHNNSAKAHEGILAPLADPTFTGIPKAPTPAQGDNSTKIATTAFVATAVAATPGIIDRDVSAHDRNANAHEGILAPLADPTFTGIPEVPTAATGTYSNQAASTKFVVNAIEGSSRIPQIVEEKIAIHNGVVSAHAALFAGKANASHTHTPAQAGAEPAGTTNEHNSSTNAHASLFSQKSNVGHRHPASEANADPAGTAEAKFSEHNSSNDAHAALLEALIPPGTVFPYAGNNEVPSMFFLCDGRPVSREEYKRLFNVIGTLYGEGDGSTTFNIPDFRGQFLRGFQDGTTYQIGTRQPEGLPDIAVDYHITTIRDGGTITSPKADLSVSYGAGHVTPTNYAIQWIIRY